MSRREGPDAVQAVAASRAGAPRTKWVALAAVSLANFMAYLDNNVTNVAIPTIQRDLHLSVAGLEWIVSSYLLVLAGLLLVGGRVADVYGRRRVFLIGLAVFTLSSLAAGLASNGGLLIGARAVQGLGAAMLMPTSLAIILATFKDAKERTAAIGIWGGVGALALALGPVIGGIISQHIHWGWIFIINVPVGVVTLVIALPSIAESRAERLADGGTSLLRQLDFPGLVTSALALFSLTYALIEGQDKGWTSTQILAAFGIAFVALAAFLAIETRSQYPMVSLPIFRSREFSGGTVTMMIWGFGILGIYFFTSLYLQGILGFSPTKAGLAFVPMALCVAVFSVTAPRVVAVLGGHRTVALGMLVMAVGLVLFARIGAGAGYGSLMPGFILFGAGAGLMNVPLTNAIMDAAPAAHAGVASALLNTSREVSGLLGVTLLGAVLRSRESSSLRGGASSGTAFIDGYHAALWVTIALLAVGVVLSYLTLRPRPALDVSGSGVAESDTDAASTATGERAEEGTMAAPWA
jgi:EmrB/QacA subfamily drug resistance transporter